MKEKTVTPNIRIMEAKILSIELTGVKSPNPIVESVVIAKYHTLISLSHPESSLGYPNIAVLKVGFIPFVGSPGTLSVSYSRSTT